MIRNQQVIGSSPIAGSIQIQSLTAIRTFSLFLAGCVWVADWLRVELVDRGAVRTRNQMPVDIDRHLDRRVPELSFSYCSVWLNSYAMRSVRIPPNTSWNTSCSSGFSDRMINASRP